MCTDAIVLLRNDHKQVRPVPRVYCQGDDGCPRSSIVKTIIERLTVPHRPTQATAVKKAVDSVTS